jgi:hypothetical protein
MFEKISNNKKLIFLLSILISFISVFPSTINYIYINSDLTFHIYRIQEMTNNIINDRIWLPALQGNNIFGYGYLVDIFYPNAFLYPAALLNILIKNPLISFKILIFLYSIFTFYVAYFSCKITTKNNIFSLCFASLYSLYYYRIMGLYENGFVGEFLAYAFLPLVIFGTHRLFKEKKWVMLSIGMIGILYTHLITLLLASIYIGIYLIINTKKVIKEKEIIINLIKTTIVTIMVGLGFLIPFCDYMKSDSFKFDINADKSGILSYGLFNLPLIIEIILQIFIIIACFYLYKKINKKSNKDITKCYFICIYSFLALTKIFPWELFEYVPFLRNIQFSLRILNLISPIIIIIITELCLSIKEMDKVMFIAFIALILTYLSFTMYSANKLSPEEKTYYTAYKNHENYIENTFIDIVAGEYMPITFSVNQKELFDINDNDLLSFNKIIINKNVEKYDFKNNNSLTSYLNIETKEPVDISFPLTYYKNYKAYLNNKEINVYEIDGRVYLKNVTSGEVIIKYEISNLQIISALISLISSLLFLIYIFKNLFTKNENCGKI